MWTYLATTRATKVTCCRLENMGRSSRESFGRTHSARGRYWGRKAVRRLTVEVMDQQKLDDFAADEIALAARRRFHPATFSRILVKTALRPRTRNRLSPPHRLSRLFVDSMPLRTRHLFSNSSVCS